MLLAPWRSLRRQSYQAACREQGRNPGNPELDGFLQEIIHPFASGDSLGEADLQIGFRLWLKGFDDVHQHPAAAKPVNTTAVGRWRSVEELQLGPWLQPQDMPQVMGRVAFQDQTPACTQRV